MASDFLNFGLLPSGHRVRLRGFSGLTFTYPGLLKNLKSVCAPGYQVVLLAFGTNDLAAGCAVELLVDMVWSEVETPRSCYGVRQVALMEKNVLVLQDGTPVCPALTTQPGHTMTSYGSVRSVLTVCMYVTIKGW